MNWAQALCNLRPAAQFRAHRIRHSGSYQVLYSSKAVTVTSRRQRLLGLQTAWQSKPPYAPHCQHGNRASHSGSNLAPVFIGPVASEGLWTGIPWGSTEREPWKKWQMPQDGSYICHKAQGEHS